MKRDNEKVQRQIQVSEKKYTKIQIIHEDKYNWQSQLNEYGSTRNLEIEDKHFNILQEREKRWARVFKSGRQLKSDKIEIHNEML